MEWIHLLSPARLSQTDTPETGLYRSEFDKDVDRIIFSHPFRRLQDKTQVVPLPEHDFVHTRLTHSLEVSSVGRYLGKKVAVTLFERYLNLGSTGISPSDVGSAVAAACLAHDIGNPPFGHSGEQAISQVFKNGMFSYAKAECTPSQWADLENFEGNAQGFRLLAGKGKDGLKLTVTTLGAFLKYPRESVMDNPNPAKRSHKKYGFFQSEKPLAKKLSELASLTGYESQALCFSRHPLVYLTEAADDVCYLIIDLEDAVRMRVVSEKEYVELLQPILGDSFNVEKYRAMTPLNDRIGLLRAMAINKLADECADYFLEHEQQILSGELDQSLSDIISRATLLKEISRFSVKNIYNSQQVLEIQAAGFKVLPGLMEIFMSAAEDARQHNGKPKNPANKNNWDLFKALTETTETPSDFYSTALMVIDFVSGLTDRHAVRLFRKLSGLG
ncbi:MAG: dNTP triphosphohydrolase [Flavobacteriales bacterium]|nr:dNTP triphosphohydrolase [Flavobacteriales bacterium]